MKSLPQIDASLSMSQVQAEPWDLLVLGAGIAGSALALRSAAAGMKVLLVEAKSFPRDKVCGGCLNPRSIRQLEQLGLSQVLHTDSVRLEKLQIHRGRRSYSWKLPGLRSVHRSTLDLKLVQAAVAAGARFLPLTSGQLTFPEDSSLPFQTVRLKPRSPVAERMEVESRSVVVASGLTRSPLNGQESWPFRIASHSKIGVQSFFTQADLDPLGGFDWTDPTLHMVLGRSGYVGLCPTIEGWNMAGALSPSFLTGPQAIGMTVQDLLLSAGMPGSPTLARTTWLTTPHLTRESKLVAQHRVFLLGDSLGYVEPFTGEGMAWALEGAERLQLILLQLLRSGDSHQCARVWSEWVQRQRRFRQTICRWSAQQLRTPWRTDWLLRVLNWASPLRNWMVQRATCG